jgi:ATP-dependent RNA helicase DeaD
MKDFEKLGLSQPLVENIETLGFITPTTIQTQAIPKLLEDNKDLVGLAQTGTGKTAAFGLPLLELVDVTIFQTQALVLAPTRELCLQISKELIQFGSHIKKLRIQAVYGGTDIVRQMREIKKGAHIIVATPGRLRDLIRRKAVNISEIGYVVLDEADEMLNMGFKEEIDDILKNTPEEKLTWLFSATMPDDVRRIARSYMSEPLELRVGEKNVGHENIDHKYVIVRGSERYEALKRFLDYEASVFGLIFTRTRRDSMKLAELLSRDGYNSDALHGDLNQSQRDRVMASFRTGRIKILVATDVAARGIDVQDITHVFHYNIPEDLSFYTHRSGRTGRAGKKGVSLVLAHPKDMGLIRLLERKMKVRFSIAHIPTGREICSQRLLQHIKKIKEVQESEEIQEFLPSIYEQFNDLSKEEIIEKIATLSFSRFLKKYRYAEDLNPTGKGRQKPGSSTGIGVQRLFINIGTMDVHGKVGFLTLISEHAQIPRKSIGRVDMQKSFSFFEVENEMAGRVINAFQDSDYQGRSIRINDEKSSSKKRDFKKKKSFKKFKRRG